MTAEETREVEEREDAEYEAERLRLVEDFRKKYRRGRTEHVVGARRRSTTGERQGPGSREHRAWERSSSAGIGSRGRNERMRDFSGGSRKRKASVPIRRPRST